MSKFSILYTCHELPLSEDGEVLNEFDHDLPHKDQILEELCSDWNSMHDLMVSLVNEECGDAIQSCRMRPYRHPTDTIFAIDFVAKQGKRLTTGVKAMISDFVSAQFSDGWGEGVFGYGNIMTAKDGSKFIVE